MTEEKQQHDKGYMTGRCFWKKKCLCKTSLIKPPSPVTTIFAKSVPFRSTTEATVKLVTSLILSCFDYCSSLFSGLVSSSVFSLQNVLNCPAHLILKKNQHKSDYTPRLFQSLHWLPVSLRIHYKINTLFYKCIMHTVLS